VNDDVDVLVISQESLSQGDDARHIGEITGVSAYRSGMGLSIVDQPIQAFLVTPYREDVATKTAELESAVAAKPRGSSREEYDSAWTGLQGSKVFDPASKPPPDRRKTPHHRRLEDSVEVVLCLGHGVSLGVGWRVVSGGELSNGFS
jgi:hypothetical protein